MISMKINFNNFCITDKSHDLQGSHWAPHLIHRKLWEKVGGFSDEFNPEMVQILIFV